MLREMRELDTPAARELRAVLDRGDLVDDELMIDLIRDRLARGDTRGGFVLDGQVPDRGVVLERLLARAASEGRSDDTPGAIQRRLELYDRETAPLVDYYRTHQANVVGVHADRTVEQVFHEIEATLSSVEARA